MLIGCSSDIGRVFGSLAAVLSLAAVVVAAEAGPLPRLQVSDNHRYLVEEGGKPFFYLGDTAWELFHRLDREQAETYLADRAEKGFTVIQAVALAELDGLQTPNAYGHRPLIDNDPQRCDVKDGEANDYWDHVDWIVRRANALGMYVGLLPTWGDKWNKKWGAGPEIFTPENAEAYGAWLGRRYQDDGILWILGGDRPVDNERQREIIRAMARGLRKGDGGNHRMTLHPCGGRSSAEWFHGDEWLDFNMVQSGHGRPHVPGYRHAAENLAREPAKPTLDGEPCYEDHPVKGETWNRRQEPGVLLAWFDEWDVRVAAYESILAGSCGHTYGDHNIWQMWRPGREPLSVARTPWTDALDHPGSRQMQYFREMFEARPFWKLVPDQSLIGSDNPADEHQARAARAADGSFALVYVPTGKRVAVEFKQLGSKGYAAWWFNPRQHACQLIGRFPASPRATFHPPTAGRGNDWLLVIDDASRELPRIGFSHQNIMPTVKP